MELRDLKPRKGSDTYRIGDSDDLVVMENIGAVPSDKVCLQEHGIIFLCIAGKAQFEYDGKVIQLRKNDLFLYMVHSVACDFMATSDFNCRQIWFNRGELWNINIYSGTSLADMSYLKSHPLVHLTSDDAALLNTYFHLLCQRMKSPVSVLTTDIVRSLFGTILLELLAVMRRHAESMPEPGPQDESSSSLHKRRIIDKFMQLVEQSDGRVRKVDEFASQLNVTPKYLSTILKEVMNRRPSIYIQLFTLGAIERRLRFTDMTMQEIANDLNFPNASFFGKYFREHTGMTPMEYRLKYHQGIIRRKE